jgi:hypothetical protein
MKPTGRPLHGLAAYELGGLFKLHTRAKRDRSLDHYTVYECVWQLEVISRFPVHPQFRWVGRSEKNNIYYFLNMP